MAFERDNQESIAEALENMIPDEKVRRTCLNFLADSIDYAYGCAADRWGLTAKKDLLRLNVGKIEVIAIFPDIVRCLIDLDTIPEGLWSDERLALKENEQDSRMGVYTSVPGSVICNVLAVDFPEVLPLFRASHRVLIDNASRTGTNPMTRKGHSPAAVDYLSSYLGRDLPQPMYSATRQSN
jgi:hypothetical protein